MVRVRKIALFENASVQNALIGKVLIIQTQYIKRFSNFWPKQLTPKGKKAFFDIIQSKRLTRHKRILSQYSFGWSCHNMKCNNFLHTNEQ